MTIAFHAKNNHRTPLTQYAQSNDSVEISKELSSLNLTYLLLAQKMLKQDRVGAMLKLGLSHELAAILTAMALSQIVWMAETDNSLCGFRLDQLPPTRLMNEGADPVLQKAHLTIVLASRAREAAAA